MPVAILKFKLPEEWDEYRAASRAGEMLYEIHEFLEYVRQKDKYADEQSVTWTDLRATVYTYFGQFQDE